MENNNTKCEEIDFLLPNGFVRTINCNKSSLLSNVKTELWQQAVSLPAANHLRNQERYVFIGVTEDGCEVQFVETARIGDLQLLYPILEVSEPKVTRDLNKLEQVIGDVLSQPVQYLDSVQDIELQRFRRDINHYCTEEVLEERDGWRSDEQMQFYYPAILDLNSDLPMNTVKKIMDANNWMTVRVWSVENEKKSLFNVQVHTTDTPLTVVKATIETKYKQRNFADFLIQQFISNADRYALNVCGSEEYLLKDCCLHMYKYIRWCLEHDIEPELKLVSMKDLYDHMPPNTCLVLPEVNVPEPPVTKVTSSWDLPHCQYSIRVFNLPGKYNDIRNCRMYVEAQLFHGTQPLCKPIRTMEAGWNKPWKFDVSVQNLPQCARLCFTVCAAKSGTQQAHGISWVNLQVFDSEGRLTVGRREVGVWKFPQSNGQTKYPLGTPGSNYDKEVPTLDFEVVSPCDGAVEYPSTDEINKRIILEDQIQASKDRNSQRDSISNIMRKQGVSSFDKIDRLAAADPICSLSPVDLEFLWINRNLVMDYVPNILPKIIQHVNWLNRDHVFELYRLLWKWPQDQIYLCTTLHLLDVQFADTRVRDFAVDCLERLLVDEEEVLQLYLLQLVQVERLESYRDNRLCQFLLQKALLNRRIGHSFFWYMRSELHGDVSRNRFSPILEAFCHFCGAAILKGFTQEIRSIDTWSSISMTIKRRSDSEDGEKVLREILQDEATRDAISMTTSVLDSSIELGDICPDQCKVMQSKMKPLWLDWKNGSSTVDNAAHKDVIYIFKNGDDLRQDMLVLQLIQVMNMIWKSTCHDYSLIPYGCISLGDEVGMIEVVRDSTTVHNIMTGMGIDSSQMNEWLHKHNMHRYEDAVRTFTYSCAGYCVATFILGIGDRHSDNIMVTTNGQLFHIDYGHFMGTVKQKLGIKRERVPFVLTKDFINIIAKGKPMPEDTDEYENFIYLCFEAYITLRRNSSLLLTLLKLMMHSNISELNQMSHIQYARESLAVEKSESEAGSYFLKMHHDSSTKQWTTKVDWFFHRVNKHRTKKTSQS